MLSLLLLFFVAGVVTLVATPLAALLGRRMGAWDHPDELGIHKESVPRTGGIAIAIGLFISVQAAWSQSTDIIASRLVMAVAVGSSLVFIVGLLDDLREIKPLAKALGLVAASVVSLLISPHATLTGFERLDFIIGLVILMLGANSINLLDGMDGLASGVAVIACLGFGIISYMENHPLLTAQAIMTAGAALGFWLSNRPPARLFMGDCGSLMLGFILASMALRTSSYGIGQMISAIAVLSVPILDTGMSMLRRVMAGTDIFSGDRKHIYDLLYEKQRSQWKVIVIVYLMAALSAGLGVAAIYIPWKASLALLAGMWAFMVLWMARLGMFARTSPSRQQTKSGP